MTSLLDIPLRTAEAEDEEIAQALFGTVKIILRIWS